MSTNQTDTSWTDERVATLRKLHDAGMSNSEIARRLGGITRNAVIGKLNRLGLRTAPAQTRQNVQRGHAKVTAALAAQGLDRAGKPRPPKPARAMAEPSTDIRKVSFAGGRVHILGPAAPLPKETAHDGPVIALEDLGPCDCKWPLGDTRSPAFGFCGKPRADDGQRDPYCEDHQRRARVKSKPVEKLGGHEFGEGKRRRFA